MNLRKEIPLIAIVLLPFIYLAYVWKDLPNKVPIHWNLEGEADGYGSKTDLMIIPFLLPLLTYLIFLVIPKIDPKSKLENMGGKLDSFKFILISFMAVLATYIVHTAKVLSLGNPNFLLILIGVLFLVLGNFFQTIKPNYFLGIRTPWTLENDIVWKETHKLGGKITFIGGLLIIISSLILQPKHNFIVLLVVSIIVVIVPIVYSYFKFKQLKTA